MRKIEKVRSRYYTVKQIQQLECCGKDKAYELAKRLAHEIREKNQIFVFSEAYDEYYENKKKQAMQNKDDKQNSNNIYAIRRLNERR